MLFEQVSSRSRSPEQNNVSMGKNKYDNNMFLCVSFSVCRAHDDDDDEFMNDDPAFDDVDPENKENAIELGTIFVNNDNDMQTIHRR
jgi:hypothetical protein